MPDLAAAELSIPAEQIPDPAKPLVVPVDTTVVSSELLYSAFHSMGDSGQSSCAPIPWGASSWAGAVMRGRKGASKALCFSCFERMLERKTAIEK